MKNLYKFIYLFVFLIISFNTYAGQPGFYIGGSLGYTDSDLLSDEEEDAIEDWTEYWTAAASTAGLTLTTDTDTDENDLGFKFFAGYNLNQYIGIEAGYVNLGDVDLDATLSLTDGIDTFTASGNANVEADGFSFAGVLSYPIFNKTSVYGKVGFFVWDAELEVEAEASLTYNGVTYYDSGSYSDDDDGVDIMFGFGASYQFTDHIGVRGEWERYALDDYDIDLFSVGLQYNF